MGPESEQAPKVSLYIFWTPICRSFLQSCGHNGVGIPGNLCLGKPGWSILLGEEDLQVFL